MPAKSGLVNPGRRAKPLTVKEGLSILERDRFRCQYCGLDGMTSFENYLVLSVDFIMPRARGGKKSAQNLVTACRPCNLLKGRRSYASLEDAKTHVLQRRGDLRKDWEAKVARLQGP